MGDKDYYRNKIKYLTRRQIKRTRYGEEMFRYKPKYSGMEAITESYTEIVNGVKIIRVRTRYRKKQKKKK